EGSSNNDTFAHATQLAFPSGGYTGATPLMAFGDVGSASDVDVFALRPMSNYTGPVTFQLRSAGLSLLAPKITIFDARGNVLGQAQSTTPQGDTVSVRLAAVNPQATYFVRVEGATRDVFGIGRYALVTTFDAVNQTAGADVDRVARQPGDDLGADTIQALLRHEDVLFHDDHQADDSTGRTA